MIIAINSPEKNDNLVEILIFLEMFDAGVALESTGPEAKLLNVVVYL